MVNINPALFYLWAHENPEEFNVPFLRDLISRVNVLYNEGVSSDVSISGKIQRDWQITMLLYATLIKS